jgi:transcriptional regulator with XRE-family HTH domain
LDEEEHYGSIFFAETRPTENLRSFCGAALESSHDDRLRKEFMDPGTRLKEVRGRLGISTREVALFSKTIADAEGNPEFLISGPWLTQIENDKASLPSIYKLFTLASVYGLSYPQVLALYGVDIKKLKKYHSEMQIAKTHLTEYGSGEERPASFEIPVRFDAGMNLGKTNLLPRMIESWGTVPLEFIQHFDLRHRSYGFVGMKDYTLYPLIRPGSFVEIDPEVKTPRHGLARSEFDRPIYFVDLRNEYACSWCELVEDKLLLLAHPLSPVKTRIFAFPREAEIIGQVTGVAMRLVVSLPDSRPDASKLPSQP